MAGKHTSIDKVDVPRFGTAAPVGSVALLLKGQHAGLSATVRGFDASEWSCYTAVTIDGTVYHLTPYELVPFPSFGRHRAH